MEKSNHYDLINTECSQLTLIGFTEWPRMLATDWKMETKKKSYGGDIGGLAGQENYQLTLQKVYKENTSLDYPFE